MHHPPVVRQADFPVYPPLRIQNYGEQMLDIIKSKNIPHKTVPVNGEGHIIAGRNKDPDLYDWGVNG